MTDITPPEGWTEEEQRVLVEHRWWDVADIRASNETIWPTELAEMLDGLGYEPFRSARRASDRPASRGT